MSLASVSPDMQKPSNGRVRSFSTEDVLSDAVQVQTNSRQIWLPFSFPDLNEHSG